MGAKRKIDILTVSVHPSVIEGAVGIHGMVQNTPAGPLKTPAKPAPWLAVIDTPNDGRLYFRAPVEPESYNPAIAVFRGVIRPSYAIPNRLEGGMVYFDGSEAICKGGRELMGIHCALKLMGKVWQGLLDKHGGARNDIEQQNEIVKGLVGPPLPAFTWIKSSGKLGSEGVPQKAADYFRNVMALAYWGAIWAIRKPGKGVMLNGKPKPGQIRWDVAAATMNHIFLEAFPDLAKRQWTAFTGDSLRKLVEQAVILDVKSGV